MSYESVFFSPDQLTLIAGPCSIDSEETYFKTITNLKALGVHALRGAIFKMRTNPLSFQGMGFAGLDILKKARKQLELPIVTEVTDPRQIESLMDTVDMFQVGARSMYNYELLKELAATNKPVLLKRAFSALIDEWIGSAEYLANGGNEKVILCERGIRTFETKTRNTLDLNAVAYLKANTPFKVFVDPSHGTGHKQYVRPMALAAVAAGADGLIIEVHDDISKALSDKLQALTSDEFALLVKDLKAILPTFGKRL